MKLKKRKKEKEELKDPPEGSLAGEFLMPKRERERERERESIYVNLLFDVELSFCRTYMRSLI